MVSVLFWVFFPLFYHLTNSRYVIYTFLGLLTPKQGVMLWFLNHFQCIYAWGQRLSLLFHYLATSSFVEGRINLSFALIYFFLLLVFAHWSRRSIRVNKIRWEGPSNLPGVLERTGDFVLTFWRNEPGFWSWLAYLLTLWPGKRTWALSHFSTWNKGNPNACFMYLGELF